MNTLALLTVALLFGGTVLYSFGFAAALFTTLPPEQAGATLRRVFPHFYLFVVVTSAVGAALLWTGNPLSAYLLAGIAITTLPTRQVLMPAINAATDAGNKPRFNMLHGLSVVVTLAHIVVAAVVLARFV